MSTCWRPRQRLEGQTGMGCLWHPCRRAVGAHKFVPYGNLDTPATVRFQPSRHKAHGRKQPRRTEEMGCASPTPCLPILPVQPRASTRGVHPLSPPLDTCPDRTQRGFQREGSPCGTAPVTLWWGAGLRRDCRAPCVRERSVSGWPTG